MAAVHKELQALIEQLSEEAAERYLREIQHEIDLSSRFDYEKWWRQVDALRETIYARHGKFFDSMSVLEEIREERLNDLTGGR